MKQDQVKEVRMASLRVERYVVGTVHTNCYFAVNEDTKETVVIDPGSNAKQLIGRIEEENLKPAAILLTHGHFDHAGGAAELAQRYGILVYAHEEEQKTLSDPAVNLSGWEGRERTYHADCFLRDEQELKLAGFQIRVLYTPGHTPGSCCLLFPYQKAVFSGDTLFARSVGRSDFPGGSASTLIRSIKEKLMTLPEEITVYPGHDESTTIGTERMYNPYL